MDDQKLHEIRQVVEKADSLRKQRDGIDALVQKMSDLISHDNSHVAIYSISQGSRYTEITFDGNLLKVVNEAIVERLKEASSDLQAMFEAL